MRKLLPIVVILFVSSFLTSCKLKPQPGHVKDEALRVTLSAKDYEDNKELLTELLHEAVKQYEKG